MGRDRMRNVLAKCAVLMIVVALAGAGVGGLMASRSVPASTAQSRLFFSVQGGNSATDLNQASTYLERQMTSFVQVAGSDRVLVPAARRVGNSAPADIASSVTVTNPTNTVLLDVEATDAHPERAVALADAVTAEIVTAVAQLSPSTDKGVKTLQAGTIQRARVVATSAPSPLRGALTGGLLGLMAGALLTFILFRQRRQQVVAQHQR